MTSKLGKCSVCAKPVSSSAVACPHCGQPSPFKEQTWNLGGWNATAMEVAEAWLAYKELVSQKKAGPGVEGRVTINLGRINGWKRKGWFGIEYPPSAQHVADRIERSPWDFYIAFEAGMDIVSFPGHWGMEPRHLSKNLREKGWVPDPFLLASATALFESEAAKVQTSETPNKAPEPTP